MKVLSLVLSFLFSLFFVTNCQAQKIEEPCGSGYKHEQLMRNDANYRSTVDAINERAILSNTFRTPTVHTVSVVVHVIHEGEAIGQGSNISDEQVQSAIVALNQDFRKETGSNGDGNGVDIEIEFCLASRNPDGDPTTGIMRVDGSVVTDYAEHGIEVNGGVGAVEDDVKALSVWPRTDYVNIWVVNEIEDNDASGGVQGYAYFPYDNIVDGIVVLHKAFGTVGNLKPNTDLNRVLTHEMGHYFSLYHTFHTTPTCDAETNCDTQGDRICDTPPTILNASCNSPACGATQQVENYLDYTPETCRNMFSQGQKDRMRDCLLNERASLLSSLGCTPPTENDAGVSTITGPNGSLCDTNVEAEIVLTNFGSEVLTSVDINYGLDGNLNQLYEWSGSLDPGITLEITLPGIIVGEGSYLFSAESANPNGVSDQFSSNDLFSSQFTISPGIPLVLDVTLDYYGHETTWSILDSLETIVAYGGPYPDMELGVTYQELICAPTGCYELVFYDLFGDGMGFVNGHYELYNSNDSLLAEGGGNFGSSETNEFCYVQEIPPGEAPVANFSVSESSICVGEAIDFTNQSLNQPTSWSWTFEGGSPSVSSQQNPGNITFASSGNHEITLVVSNEFGSSSSVTNIYVEANPTLSLEATDLSCFGINTGSVTSQAVGNSLSYLWSNASTQNNLSNVGPGNYTLVVTTPVGCSASSTANVGSPGQLEVSLSGQNLSCNGPNDGEVSTNVSGGIGDYSYLWNNDETTNNITGLSTGYYVVTVTDDNDCQATADITLTQSSGITINLEDTDISCSNGLGAAQVAPSGGTGNYDISWSTGSTDTSVSGLIPGDYSVTVNDNGGCSITEDFVISQTSAPTATVDATDITCYGFNDGQAVIVASGGQGNYTYTWSNGLDQSSSSTLTSGPYSVVVEDDAGCQVSVSFEIAEPADINIELMSQNPSCLSEEDGEISITVTGGTGNTSSLWNNDATTNQVFNLSSGYYSVTVSDENNCVATANVTLNQSTGIVANLMSYNIACADEFGSAEVSPEGGDGNYQITWSNGMAGENVTNLEAGNYSVSISDLTGCSTSEDFTITESDSLTVNLDIENISCFDFNDGEVSVFVSGGEGDYTYLWNTGSSSTTLDNLTPGVYSIEVVDTEECYGAASFELEQPEELTLTLVAQNLSCFNRGDGIAVPQVDGGTGLYSYAWTNGQSGSVAVDLNAGSIGVQVTDEAGCTVQANTYIDEPDPIVIDAEESTVETCVGGDGSAIATAIGGTGVLNYEWSNGTSGAFLNEVSSGIYDVEVTDENLCTETASVLVGYDCDDIPLDDLTKLIDPDCGRAELSIADYLTCIDVTEAEMYQWKFFNTEAGLFYEGYTIGSNETFQLQNVEGIHYGLSMEVCVRFQKNGNWSAFGDVCTVYMKNNVPSPIMIDSYCLEEEHQYNDVLVLNPVAGADEYQWVFTSDNPMDSITLISFVNQITITPTIGFMEDVQYQVIERVKIGASWSEFSNECPFFIRSEEIAQQVVIEENNFNIYPNPSDGNNLFLDLGNLFGSDHVIDIELYDASGKLIEIFEIIPENEATNIVTHNFKNTLAPGIYFIQYTHDGDTNEKKLIVQ